MRPPSVTCSWLKRRSFSAMALYIRTGAFTSPKEMAPVQTALGRFEAGMVSKDTSIAGISLLRPRVRRKLIGRTGGGDCPRLVAYSPAISENTRASSTSQVPSWSRHSSSTTRVSPSARCRWKSVRFATVPISSVRSVRVSSGRSSSSRSAKSWESRPAVESGWCAFTAASSPRAVRCTASFTGTSSATSGVLADRLHDCAGKARVLRQELGALALQPLDPARVLLGPALLGVEQSRLQDVPIGGLDARHLRGDLVTEVGVRLPLDRALGDALHDGGRVRDAHLQRALVRLGAADPARVQQVHGDRIAGQQLEEAVALEVVAHREERVRAGDAQELALLV